MTAVSIAIARGVDVNKSANYTVTANAPTSLDVEVRYQLLDAQSKQLTKKDLLIALEGIIRAIEQGKGFLDKAVTGTNFTGPQI
jgi:hypothetical protein